MLLFHPGDYLRNILHQSPFIPVWRGYKWDNPASGWSPSNTTTSISRLLEIQGIFLHVHIPLIIWKAIYGPKLPSAKTPLTGREIYSSALLMFYLLLEIQ